MVEITLTPAPTLGGLDFKIGPNKIVESDDLVLMSVVFSHGREADMTQVLNREWSLSMPSATRFPASLSARAVRITPDQLMPIIPNDSLDSAEQAHAKLVGSGYTIDQTDVWVVLDVSGSNTLAAIERLCPIDFDADSFPTDASARTLIEHMGTLVLRLDADHLQLYSAGSSASSFLHTVETSHKWVA